MIFGDYPCCGGRLALAVPDQTPVFAQEDCPHCGAPVWHRLSRFLPESWTEAGFKAEYDHDPKTNTVTPRPSASPPTQDAHP